MGVVVAGGGGSLDITGVVVLVVVVVVAVVGLQLYPRQGRGVVGYGTRALFPIPGFLLG